MLFLLPGTLFPPTSLGHGTSAFFGPQFSSPLPRTSRSNSMPRVMFQLCGAACAFTHLLEWQLSLMWLFLPPGRGLWAGQSLCLSDPCIPACRTTHVRFLLQKCWLDGWVDRRMAREVSGWVSRWMDGWVSGWGWIDGWKHEQDGLVTSRMFLKLEAGFHDNCGLSSFWEEFPHQSCWRRGRGLLPWILILQTVSISPAHWTASLKMCYRFRG